MEIFRFSTIRIRLVTASLVAITVGAGIYGALWYLRAVPAWETSLARQHAAAAASAATEIKDFVDDRLRAMIAASELGEVWAMKPESQELVLRRLLKLDPVIQELAIVNDSGKEVLRLSRVKVYTTGDLRSRQEEPIFRRAIAGDVFIGHVYYASTREPFLTVAAPIRFAGSEIRGVISAELALSRLWDVVSKIKVGKSGFLMVVDRDGELIVHPDFSKVLLNVNLSSDPEVRRLLKHERSSEPSAARQRYVGGKQVIWGEALVPALGWGVIAQEPVETALSDIFQVQNMTFAIILVSITGAAALSFYFSERIARPIRQLENSARRIAQGDLEQKLEIHSGDEVERLANQFEDMKLALKSSYRELENKIAERARVGELLEITVRELERQKFALDEHAIVSITDTEGKIIYANDKFVQISGYSHAELLGQNHRMIKSGLHVPSYYQAMWTMISSGKVWHGEFANRRKDGSIYWVNSTIVPLLDKNGLPYQYVGIRTDITAEKEAAAALAQARQREIEIGHQIQKSLLFGEPPSDLPGVEIASFTQPSQGIDGDFFEFFVFSDSCFDVMIGDVMGKGVTAALIGAAVKSHYNSIVSELVAQAEDPNRPPDPALIINRLNRRLSAELMRLEAFVTLAYYRIDLGRSLIEYVDAGHTPAILSSPNSKSAEFLTSDNLPIGIDGNETYRCQPLPCAPGDLLFLYSDGVTEARNPQRRELGLEPVRNLVQGLVEAGVPPAMLNQCVRRQVAQFEGSEDRRDDFTTIAIQVRDLHSRRRAREFARAFDELKELRNWLSEAVHARMSQERLHQLTLAAVEVATNIIRHADRPVNEPAFLCHIEPRHDTVTLDFYYLGESFEPGEVSLPELDGEREGGIGLYIIQRSVDHVEYTKIADGVNRVRLRIKPSVEVLAAAAPRR